ncbi:hypothetical protein KTU82_23870, partial [Escherichia coli]|uniref:hypothetical protein n=1 Tax=Escherichia coli TaxID=562 RepID=UPI00265C8C5B
GRDHRSSHADIAMIVTRFRTQNFADEGEHRLSTLSASDREPHLDQLCAVIPCACTSHVEEAVRRAAKRLS